MKIFPREFFARPTLDVARELIGCNMLYHGHKCMITETEAYVQDGDPACHAAKGMTPRNKAMFGPAGHSYVYFIYGMYHCLNIVTEEEGFGAAVLIRGVRIDGVHASKTNGPGKLCRHLDITRADNGRDMTLHSDFCITTGRKPEYATTPRIGISKGKELPWRFVMTL